MKVEIGKGGSGSRSSVWRTAAPLSVEAGLGLAAFGAFACLVARAIVGRRDQSSSSPSTVGSGAGLQSRSAVSGRRREAVMTNCDALIGPVRRRQAPVVNRMQFVSVGGSDFSAALMWSDMTSSQS
uniref:Uncharacterized protein n=1 Tax=Compsopogon caeruleus TaxID=31354 RepID=A0A7S1XGT3_9RHOD|mmetsp:Transcript_678/g.1412  ORF Transcript_678/g.1412 Transcript_678/m.1412 type:complete len:126 (+) Transcript_678:179-556(+)|eukprot:CAMPEP_0184680192 /NCGR_PEP_ID=MMETSP0312-20130426/3065_1 /TAXON_ID=31354 /ORGANISM="Compsopogon coeruleus, Strain SAG 36.94" /LENGTH=125 /DNA_ID=CAMNT_0027130133 /DNA_START=178 /DNA_END=555 /DNA_ORIENTATION=-